MYAHPRTGSACDVALSRTISGLVPVLADNSPLLPAVLSQPLRRSMLSPKKIADAQVSTQGSQDKKKRKNKSKGKDRKTRPTAKSGDVDFDENAQTDLLALYALKFLCKGPC